MSINAKKSAVRNQLTYTNNQLSQVFSVNSGTVSLNTTSNIPVVSNGTYFIPLVSVSSGSSSLNVNADLSYNANTSTLTLKNLTVQNPPVCYADPSNSYDLINKAHLNKYVGDYTQGWVCDDWLTGDVSGSLRWVSTVANSGTITSQTSEAGHIGIVRLNTANNIATSSAALSLNTNIGYSSSKIKSLRFVARPLVNSDLSSVELYLGIGNSLASSTKIAAWRYYAGDTSESANKWECFVNGNVRYSLSSLGESPLNNYFNNQWVVFEIEFDSLGYPSFYITLQETTARTLVYRENTTVVDPTILIRPFVYINSITGASKQIDVDYVDWLYTNMSRA
jgi:hypothetical protein